MPELQDVERPKSLAPPQQPKPRIGSNHISKPLRRILSNFLLEAGILGRSWLLRSPLEGPKRYDKLQQIVKKLYILA